MENFVEIVTDPAVMYGSIIFIVCTLAIILLKFVGKKTGVPVQEQVEAIEHIKDEAQLKVQERIIEKLEETKPLVPLSELIIPMPPVKTPRESETKPEVLEDEKDEEAEIRSQLSVVSEQGLECQNTETQNTQIQATDNTENIIQSIKKRGRKKKNEINTDSADNGVPV